MTPPMKRRVEGRNIEDSDAELYAEYHGTDSVLSDDLDISSCLDNSAEVRHRVKFSVQPEFETVKDKYELHPNLSSTIETNFTSMYREKPEASQKTNVGQGERSASTSAGSDTKINESDKSQTSAILENLNSSAETGYDFRTKFDELYTERRHIMEDGRRRQSERRRSQERQLLNDSLSNRSKSWSEGNWFYLHDMICFSFSFCERIEGERYIFLK